MNPPSHLPSACVIVNFTRLCDASPSVFPSKTIFISPQPNSGRLTRSPGFVNKTCTINSLMRWSILELAERPQALSGKEKRGTFAPTLVSCTRNYYSFFPSEVILSMSKKHDY